MIHTRIIFTILGFSFLFHACEKQLPEELLQELEKNKPDRRTEVYNLNYDFKDGIWVFALETSNPDRVSSLSNVIGMYLNEAQYRIDTSFLPDSSLGDTLFGIVNVSVGNLRRTPRHSAELVDQVLMGMPLKLLKKESYWYLVQTPYNYLGWITRGSMKRITAGGASVYKNSERLVLIRVFEQILSEAVPGSPVVADAVLGCVFRFVEKSGNWARIKLPDDREGYLPLLVVERYRPSADKPALNRQDIVGTARSLMGIPYLWGGHSTKGFDCSGFSSTVFRTSGYQLPRDANMQAEIGDKIEPDEDYKNIYPGDLIFFGSESRITHVGICLGGTYFIHCSDDVHINSLDENDVLYNEYRKKTYRFIRRIIND